MAMMTCWPFWTTPDLAMTKVKICGISTQQSMQAAIDGGAAFVGLVFFEKSPRNVSAQQAAALVENVPASVSSVGLFVNPTDAFLETVIEMVDLDYIQLHGGESPARVDEIAQKFGRKIIKAIGVSDAADLEKIDAYRYLVDLVLLDAKPPKNATLPGGNGLSFDWRILDGLDLGHEWMLAGGLDPLNAAEAVRLTGAPILDVSSGVESAPGVKDDGKIAAFLQAVNHP